MTLQVQELQRYLELCKHSPLKYLDYLSCGGISFDEPLDSDSLRGGSSPIFRSDDLLNKLHSEWFGCRMLVLREPVSKRARWDHELPVLLIEPTIWYFDPNSPVQKMSYHGWMNAVPETSAMLYVSPGPTAQQSFLDFLVEVDERYRPQKHTRLYGGLRVYR
jgi:hypothetical protein